MGNMKANRKFKEEDNAVSAVIGVILMVAITVAIAATVYVYVSGMLGSGPSTSPTLGMVQSGNYITIQSVQGGPILWTSTIRTIINVNGTIESSATVGYQDVDGDTKVSGGDTLSVTGTLSGGEPYTITIVYNDNAIGTVKYIPI